MWGMCQSKWDKAELNELYPRDNQRITLPLSQVIWRCKTNRIIQLPGGWFWPQLHVLKKKKVKKGRKTKGRKESRWTHICSHLMKTNMALSKELGKENQPEQTAPANTLSYVFHLKLFLQNSLWHSVCMGNFTVWVKLSQHRLLENNLKTRPGFGSHS